MSKKIRCFEILIIIAVAAFFWACGHEADQAVNDRAGVTAPEKSLLAGIDLYEPIWTSSSFNDTITAIDFHPDGTSLAVGTDSTDNAIRLFNSATGKVYKTIETPFSWQVKYLSAGKTLISGALGTIKLWDSESGSELMSIEYVSGSLRSMELTPDEKVLITGGLDKYVRFWDVSTGELIREIEIGGFSWFNAISPDGKYLATGGNPDVQVIDLRDNQTILTLKGYVFDPMNTANNDTFSAVFTPDSKYLVTGGADMTIRSWKIPSGELAKEYEKENSVIRELAITPDGKKLIAGKFIDISIYDFDSGDCLKLIPDIRQTSAIAISPAGKTMAAGGVNRILRLWKILD